MHILALFIAVLALTVEADGIGGHWTLEADVAGHAVNLRCTMVQGEGQKFSGNCNLNDSGTVTVKGETEGQHVVFAFTTDEGYTLNYTGTMEADKMQGQVEVMGTSSDFTGKRTDTGERATSFVAVQ